MNLGIQLAEKGWVPEAVVRYGIRKLLDKRLRDEAARYADRDAGLTHFVQSMGTSPVAHVPDLANRQHYEVPADFFQAVLGAQLKYSSGYWPESVDSLDEAEEAMLRLTASRAQLAPGQTILELGCGWGSLTLWMAKNYPSARIVAVSNSSSQRSFIEARARESGLDNIEIITADMNTFDIEQKFDRVVSVEMFEHMRNWSQLLERVRRWVHDDGRVFIHVFAHQRYAYPFETSADDDWMGRNFFTGGMMPSTDLMERIESPFSVERRWTINGTHYAKTAEAWLEKLRDHREQVLKIFSRDMTPAEARVHFERWRIFFLACAELFGFDDGQEWVVAHHLLAPRRAA